MKILIILQLAPMKLIQKSSFLIVILSICFFNCGFKKEKSSENIYLHKNNLKQWKKYFELIQDSSNTNINVNLNNNLILFVYPTFCGNCLNEIKFWEEFYANRPEINSELYLVVIEQYEVRLSQFVQNNNINMTILRDSVSEVRKQDLIPYLPAKVFFNNTGEPIFISPVDSKNLAGYSKIIVENISKK